jgi:hypothetical protein
MTWDHRLATLTPVLAIAIAAFVTVVTFAVYYQ